MSTIPQDHEITAWLGDTAETLTTEQREQFDQAVRDIHQRWTDADDVDERAAATTAALQYILGEVTPAAAAARLRTARIEVAEAMAAARQIAVMAVATGTPKATAAREAGIDRMTLLKDLGERA